MRARRTTSSRAIAALFGLVLLVVSVGAASVGATPAWAGDPVEDARVAEAKNLLEKLAAWTDDANKAKVEKALPKLVKVHNELKTNAMRGKLQKAAGDMLRKDELGAVRMAVADTLGRLNDPKGAYKQLKPHLPAVKVTAAGPFPLRVIQAVGALAPDSAIPTLTKLMQKAKDNNVARFAIQALGKFGWSRSRTKVLTSLAEFLRRLRPGGSDLRKGRAGGQAARVRYDFLQRTLVAALLELTGQKKYDTVDKWLVAWKANKKTPAKLFAFER